MSDFNPIKIETAEILQAVNRAEIDIQIATAKQYPRDMAQSLQMVEQIASADEDTVISLFYRLRRKDNATGEDKLISGSSVRLAEIIAACWGNLRVQCRQIANDGKTITVQAMAHDLQNNFAHSLEVKRSILTKNGKTFTQDMQTVTANAASAIAFRNAVFKVVPLAVINPMISRLRSKSDTLVKNLDKRKADMLSFFASKNISERDILRYTGDESVDKMSQSTILELVALAQEIQSGRITAEEVFFNDRRGRSSQDMADRTTANMNMAKEAMRRATQPQPSQNPQPQTTQP